MTSVIAQPVRNSLLQQLPVRQRNNVLAASEQVELAFGDILCEEGQRFSHVYLPLTAFISLVVSVSGHPALELGMIGSEGILGSTTVLGLQHAPLRALVQGKGTALRISLRRFTALLRDNAELPGVLQRYLYVLMKQVSQTAVCSHFHSLDKRLVRWLLMTHDRAHADRFRLTHQFLADMLGVQRSAVSLAANALQSQGLIHYTRGLITILDRKRLKAQSCECYDTLVDNHQQWLA